MKSPEKQISGGLSLRKPQVESLEVLRDVTELVKPEPGIDLKDALSRIQSRFPSVKDFEREFVSLCFALATGVGKTRLMGAFIAYLYEKYSLKNFFVLAPNLTIYQKLITDFTPNTAKYVFRGVSAFSHQAPQIITGDDYEAIAGGLWDQKDHVKINIFNISKINSEVRGGKSPRIKRLSEYLGQSYFDYLAGLNDLVLLMDESHRYRASAGVRAINELRPVLGLELTATPFVETSKGPVPFQNVIFDYALGQAMADGFVKEPAVVTRKNFSSVGMSADEVELLKLEDGVRLHESVKVELETYARETGQPIVKPFLLVIARDTTHARQLYDRIEAETFFKGQYRGKVIQVDSSKTGAEEDAMVQRLLKVEHREEPTEIVIHVNMLKEGWDVTNLYTIVPLRAANARILIEQSIGRGLRLPYGRRVGVEAVDRLNIVAHDRFQEILDEAKRSDSPIQMKTIVLDPEGPNVQKETVVSRPEVEEALGIDASKEKPIAPSASSSELSLQSATVSEGAGTPSLPRVVPSPVEVAIAKATYDAMREFSRDPLAVPDTTALARPEIQARIIAAVQRKVDGGQLTLPGVNSTVNMEKLVAGVTQLVIDKTISIPRIQVVPRGDLKSGYHPFKLDLQALHYQAPSEALWIQHLRTGKASTLDPMSGGTEEPRLENYIVRGLMDFDQIDYETTSDLLYDLAGQVVRHLRSYLDESDVIKVLRVKQSEIARLVFAQMQAHYWEDAGGWDVKVSRGFVELKTCAYSATAGEPPLDFRQAPAEKSNMVRYLFGGFQRCLYSVQKFHSDSERRMAVILERDAQKWFKPAKDQFQILYKDGPDPREYQPDFVAETGKAIYMLEIKARNELDSPIVIAKRDSAVRWCQLASDYAKTIGGKMWRYAIIPHDVITENMTLEGLVGVGSQWTPLLP